MFIDTHCHLDDPVLSDHLPEVLENARRLGVEKFIVPGVDRAGWERISALADAREGIYPACGLHPMHAGTYDDGVLSELAVYAERGVAIGEIGLDYLLTEIPRDLQMSAFRGQLRLAVEMGLPVLIHCRRAFQDLLRILGEERAEVVGGIMHAFSGSSETARECIKMGFAISVAGPVTYRNAVKPLEMVTAIPLDYLVLETDAPDMAPDPYRGMPNQPAYLVETAKKVAHIKGITLEEVAAVTTRNAEKLLRL